MQKNLTLTALSTIGTARVEFKNFFETFLLSGYGSPVMNGEETKHRIKNRSSPDGQRLLEARENKKRCRALIQKLERQGLIAHTQKRGRAFVCLTERGASRLARIQERRVLKEVPAATRTKNARWIIVVFDIPEGKRSKRDWIRRTLTTMGFTMVQKSVWMSQTVLPKAFVENIAERGIASHVEILEVTKEGSINHPALRAACQ